MLEAESRLAGDIWTNLGMEKARPIVIAIIAVLLAAVAALHLAACIKHRDGLRKPTKVFLVPLIICLHVAVCGFRYPYLLVGLFCGWLGDIFLIPKDRKLTFAIGALFFMAGHAFYIINTFWLGLPQKTLEAYGKVSIFIAAAAVLLVCAAAIWFMRKRLTNKMLAAFLAYMTALAFMAGTMVYSAVSVGLKPQSFMIGGGALLFAVSDFLLCTGIIRAFKIRNNRFWVMLTYILAQTGIALGFALL